MEEKGKWSCGVCKKRVGTNSVLCHSCKKLVHKRSGGVKGSLFKASQLFICRSCKVDRPITDEVNTNQTWDNVNRVASVKVDNFCYLRDMLVQMKDVIQQ